MSVAGISSSSFADYNTQSVRQRMQQFKSDFQQLGQDLQSGNLTAAQSDFAKLQQDGPSGTSSSTQSNSPVAQAINQLSTDLQAGNVTAAQQDLTTLQQDLQGQGSQGVQGHHHHHHHHGGGGSGSDSVSQLMSQLGQALQAGNLSSAQQAYSSLQSDFSQFTLKHLQAQPLTTPAAVSASA